VAGEGEGIKKKRECSKPFLEEEVPEQPNRKFLSQQGMKAVTGERPEKAEKNPLPYFD